MASFYYCDENALGLLLLKPHWITEFKYQRQNEMNPGLITKKMSACKWPINNIDLWGGGGGFTVFMQNEPFNGVKPIFSLHDSENTL